MKKSLVLRGVYEGFVWWKLFEREPLLACEFLWWLDDSVGFELNQEYIRIAEKRISGFTQWKTQKEIDKGTQQTIKVK